MPFIFKKIALTVLRILSAQISQKHFFQFFYSRTWSFSHQWKTINLGVIFFQKRKKVFYTFLQMWLCHFHMIFRIYFFKNILRKTEKEWWFYSFKRHTWKSSGTWLSSMSWKSSTHFMCISKLFCWIKSYRSSRQEVFCKKDVLRNIGKFTGKPLCQGFFFNKVACLRPATLLK